MSEDASEASADRGKLSPLPRTRRRDFKTPNRPALKGRSLLLQDSDEEGETHHTPTQPLSAPAAPSISFQEIITNLVLDDASDRRTPISKTNVRPYSTDGSSLSKDNDALPSFTRPSRDLLAQGEVGNLTDRRRHSATTSIASGWSHRLSSDSPARTPLHNESFVSLVEMQGLEREDLEMLKVLKRRQAILRELVTTELSFSQDLAVVVQEYQQNTSSCPSLTPEDRRQIFDGVEPVMSFSNDLAFELQLAAAPVLFSEAVQMQTLHHEDSRTTVGAVFAQNIPRLSKVFARYCSTHETAASCLQRVSKDTSVQNWLAQRHPKDRTTTWDLPSLLIKPVQRIMKYPLLLGSLMEATPRTHPDYEIICSAHKEMLSTAEAINNIKKRRDLVGQIAAESKRHDAGTILKTFQRRNTKVRISSVTSNDEGLMKPDVVYDKFAQAFKTQEAVLQSLKLDIQDWLAAMNSALDYHNGVAAAFAGVLFAKGDVGDATSDHVAWKQYGPAISDLKQGAFVELDHNLRSEVIEPIMAIESTFDSPSRVLARRDDKFEEFHRAELNRERGLATSAALSESADEYMQLNETLIQELPVFLTVTNRAISLVVRKLAALQSGWYRAWHTRFLALLPQDVLDAELLAHFRIGHALLLPRVAELDLINGNLAEANRLDGSGRMRTSEDNSSTSDMSTKVSIRPTMRNRALSVANTAATSLKQMTLVRNSSGSTTPTLSTTNRLS